MWLEHFSHISGPKSCPEIWGTRIPVPEVFRAKKSPPVLAPAGVVFLVNSSVAYFAYKSAIFFDLYVTDL